MENGYLESIGNDQVSVLKFQSLDKETADDQKSFFKKRFVFALGNEGFNLVEELAKLFTSKSDQVDFSDPAKVFDFINEAEAKYSKSYTSKKQRETLFKQLDKNAQEKVTLLRFLLFHFRSLILEEYFRRVGEEAPPRLESLVGHISSKPIGDILISELFQTPAGVDVEFDKSLRGWQKRQAERLKRISELKTKLEAVGKVKGVGIAKEIADLEHEEQAEKGNVQLIAGVNKLIKRQQSQFDTVTKSSAN